MKNKVAIITGAASGIGKAIAQKFAKNGIKVIVSDIDQENGKKVAGELNKEGEAIFIKADTSKPEHCEQLVKNTIAEYGALHFAVNNAGIGGEQEKTADYAVDNFKKVIDINLNGVFYGMRFQLPEIVNSGGGAIVNMASILGSVGTPHSAAYVAAKHGVVGLTKTSALEYAQKKVCINSVGPGYIETPLLNQLDEEQKKQPIQLHPIGRLGKPIEVANLVYWLCTEEASFVTGAYYTVDGGYTAQ